MHITSTIAVMPAKVLKSAAEAVEPEAFDEALLAAVQGIGAANVIGPSDIDAMLGFERQKDTLGCSDTMCFAEIGGALGAEIVIEVQVAKADGTWLVTAKVIDVRSSPPHVRARIAANDIQGSSATLNNTLPALMARLFASAGSL